ncbi:MAG: hypothetical protein A4E53_01486 [Pelotomaculum sp. PtaB.Bin104]|nr:MAG: hypothetical protein A4E53_01486 [Pelotomaculum sp. PtaB.Bin104]
MATQLEQFFNNKRKKFSLKEIKEAQERLDMRQHGRDEEYNEVILKEFTELLPYKERANNCHQ